MMAGGGLRSRKFLGGFALVFVLGCAGVGWMERSTLLSWFFVRCLAGASESERQRWAERVADLGEKALPDLLDCLNREDAQACANARAALERMTQSWGEGDPRTADLAGQVAREFAHFSPDGQKQTLELAGGWFTGRSGAGGESLGGLVTACSRLVAEAANVTDLEVQTRALDLCAILLAQPRGDDTLSAGRELVRAALRAETAENRLRAVRLALHPGMDLLVPVSGLLNDSSVDVRRAAVLVVGPARDVVHDEVLLPCLHDPDAEVRRLCEVALLSRGLRPEYLHLGRLLTDPQPSRRLQVLDELARSRDLDFGLWLRRLSGDPAPSVRAAAVRAMSQQTFVDLRDRIDQMASNDESPTVRQLAQFYLNRLRPPEPPLPGVMPKQEKNEKFPLTAP